MPLRKSASLEMPSLPSVSNLRIGMAAYIHADRSGLCLVKTNESNLACARFAAGDAVHRDLLSKAAPWHPNYFKMKTNIST
jgi:hypothetical protein